MCSCYVLPLHGSTVSKSHLSFASFHLTKQIKSAFVVLSQQQKTYKNNIFFQATEDIENRYYQSLTRVPNINKDCRKQLKCEVGMTLQG